MKKIVKYLFIFCLSLLFINTVSAKSADMYFFYGQGCPHCAQEEVFLDEMIDKYKDLNIIRYEVWYNNDNRELMQEKANELGITVTGVPLTIIDNHYVSGFNEAYEERIESLIKEATADPKEETKEEQKTEEKETTIYDIPILGKVNVKKVSVGLLSVVIGLVDGFNPCAMWVLLFLISMLIGMKDRKKMWILGSAFLLTSAIVYLLIMMSWLEIIVNVGMTIWIRNIIAVVAIIGSIINIRNYIKSKDNGCQVVDENKRSKVFKKVKKFTTEKSLFLALLGVIGLAISVNFIELVCSAGLPIIYTQILALNNITGISALLYTILYIIFFLLDDLIIFTIAMITLKVSGISTKYTKYSHLIGGIIMLLIGLLLIFKPEWIMFNF